MLVHHSLDERDWATKIKAGPVFGLEGAQIWYYRLVVEKSAAVGRPRTLSPSAVALENLQIHHPAWVSCLGDLDLQSADCAVAVEHDPTLPTRGVPLMLPEGPVNQQVVNLPLSPSRSAVKVSGIDSVGSLQH